MDDQETNSIAPKRPKLSYEDELVENQKKIAGPSNEQTSPKIFKLDVDCFDEIFEYFSLEDLDSFGQTCKAMHKLTGEYFKRNYPHARIRLKNYKPELIKVGRRRSYSFSRFHQFVSDVEFNGWNLESLLYFSSHPNEFGAINTLILTNTQLNIQPIDTLNGIFPKLETIKICQLNVKENIYDTMLKRCTNLNYLQLFDIQNDPQHEISDPNSWMRQKYPKLKNLSLSPIPSIDDLKTFFQNNPNVRIFFTRAKTIQMYCHEFKNFNVQLDVLKVFGKKRNSLSMSFCKLFNELYEIKFYKRLEIYWLGLDDHTTTDNDFSTNLASLHGLEQCFIKYERELRLFPDLPDLKKLKVFEGKTSSESTLIPKKFANLQELCLPDANDKIINMFIQGLPKLKILALRKISSESNILNLQTLNMDRQKVLEAQKVTIYVPEKVFLKTKWSIANGDINLQMIEMKRIALYNMSDFYL